MAVSQRDRRALLLLGVAVVVIVGYRFWLDSSTPQVVDASAGSVEMAEQQLERLRKIAATVPGKADLAKTLTAQVAEKEKNLIVAETAPQALAQLLQIVRRVAAAQSPALQLGSANIGQVREFGKDYGEAYVTVSLECGIEQLLNFLADVSAQPELIATSEISIDAGDEKQKMLRTRLTFSGLVARSLVPERKGLGAF